MNNKTDITDTLRKIIEDYSEVAGYLWELGWAERNDGNISVNVTGLLADQEISLEHFIFRE